MLCGQEAAGRPAAVHHWARALMARLTEAGCLYLRLTRALDERRADRSPGLVAQVASSMF